MPMEQMGSSQPMLLGTVRYETCSLVGLLDDFKLLFERLAPAALNADDHFHLSGSHRRLRHINSRIPSC
jgi:hypothetical protein